MLKASLKAGKAALEQEDYDSAIAHFQTVAETELDETIVQGAYKGLVATYTQAGRISEAIALCEMLSQLPEKYPWSMQILQDLKQQAKAKPPPKTTLETVSEDSETPSHNLPIPTQTRDATSPSVFKFGRPWRNAERAVRWTKMRKPKSWKYWLRQLVTLFAFIFLIDWSLNVTLRIINWIIVYFPFLELSPIPWLQHEIFQTVIVILAFVTLTAPWFLDWILKDFHNRETYKFSRLAAHFPETAKTIKRFAKHHKVPLPDLYKLPISAPVIFVYGNFPRTARLVISDALLEQLEDDELATIFISHFYQIVKQEFILMSSIVGFIQIPFLFYWKTAEFGEKWREDLSEFLREKLPRKQQKLIQKLPISVKILAGVFANFCYGLYWLWRVPALYFSRYRQYYNDRMAAEFTGNPNALTRALLKMTIGLAQHIERREQTIPFLEGFELLMPVGHRQSLCLGSLPAKTSFSEVLAWECTNPYRQWLALMNPHPLIGDRIYLLNRYANFWKLPPEVDLPTLVPPPKTWKQKLLKLKNSYTALPILQSAVLSGIIFGIFSRIILWVIGWGSDWLSAYYWTPAWRLVWLYNARPFVDACILAAFSLSLIIWINGYFPNIRIFPSREDPRLEDLLCNPKAVPPRSYGVKLKGKLIGRPGTSNWAGQDLILKTSTGSIKLHFISKLGQIGNLSPRPPRPVEFLNQEVTVTGWFRRGGIPWVDVDMIHSQEGKKTQSGFPVWVTILAILAALWSAYLIWQA